MERGNNSIVTEFILVGLSSDPVLQFPIFCFFLIVYMITVLGNFLLIVAVRIDSSLHNPMYLFLVNLSFLDICSTSTIIPKMLMNFQTGKKTISFAGCFIQVCYFLFFSETECLLLTFMAYDRYVAICNPLRYTTIMKTMTCMNMIGASWLSGAILSSMDTYVLYTLGYCGPKLINHFFCEAPTILQESCIDSPLADIVKLSGTILLLFVPVSFILYSYIHIFIAVFRIKFRNYKAFSTCVSHLTVVILFYGSLIFIYTKPKHREILSGKIFSVFYTTITPMLNPLIYSLRNKEVHRALQNVGKTLVFFIAGKIFKKVKWSNPSSLFLDCDPVLS